MHDFSVDAKHWRQLARAMGHFLYVVCPDYIIHLSEFHQRENRIYLIGQTVGSHLNLPWREEFEDNMIWIADVEGEQLALWKIISDTEEN
jgi:hypothetical protein